MRHLLTAISLLALLDAAKLLAQAERPQHENANRGISDGTYFSHAVADVRSDLSMVVINALGNTITNVQKRPAWVTILGTTNGRSSIHGVVEYDGHAGVSIRGNSSRAHPKKAYRLELQDVAGNDFKAPLLGMPKESDWILFAAYTDKTLIRDVLAYELWREMGHYAPRTRFVELFMVTNASERPLRPALNAEDRNQNARPHPGPLPQEREKRRQPFDLFMLPGATMPREDLPEEGEEEGERSAREKDQEARPSTSRFSSLNFSNYQGVYVLMEKIKRGKNRVNIQKSKPDPADSSWLTGGYILKKDRLNSGEVGFVSAIGMQFAFEDPKERDMLPEQKTWLMEYIRAIEHVLFGTNFLHPQLGYARYFDVDSFIDYHWMTEVGKNIDGYWFSQFYHMDRGGKLKIGPLWDWDLSFGNAFYHDGYKTNGWRWDKIHGPNYKWFARMFEDPDFLQRYIDRWAELRSTVFATSNILARVDRLVAQVQEAQVRNYQRWTNIGVYVHPNRFIGKTYQEEVDWLKNWIRDRLAWIDTQDFPPPVTQIVRDPPAAPPRLAMACVVGQILYTTDGSDPRRPGGAVNPLAQRYTEPIPLSTNVIVTARVRSEFDLWSAPVKVNGAE